MLDSDIIRPLYDVHDGGPPKGFQCQLCSCGGLKGRTCILTTNHNWCLRVTRTYRGMVAHQRIVHGFKQQGELNFEEVRPTTE